MSIDTPISLSSEFPLAPACMWFTHVIESSPFYSKKTDMLSRVPQIATLVIEALVEQDGEKKKVSFQRSFGTPALGALQKLNPFFQYSPQTLEKVLKTAWYYFNKNCEQDKSTLLKIEKIDLMVCMCKNYQSLTAVYSLPNKTVRYMPSKDIRAVQSMSSFVFLYFVIVGLALSLVMSSPKRIY